MPLGMSVEQLIVCVKAPRPGAVKTRLAVSIGDKAACDAYRKMAGQLFSRLSALSNVELRFTPDDAASEIKPWLKTTWEMRPQGQGNLGQRIQAAFAEAFSRGAQRVAIVGSDCPSVTARDIEAAWIALKTTEVVIGPARDGGYWLIALSRPQPALFDGIAWSRDTVLRETLERAEIAGLQVKLLRELSDVDTEADWHDFLAGNQKA